MTGELVLVVQYAQSCPYVGRYEVLKIGTHLLQGTLPYLAFGLGFYVLYRLHRLQRRSMVRRNRDRRVRERRLAEDWETEVMDRTGDDPDGED